MRTVHLHGKLKKYVKSIRLDVATAGEAVRALLTNYPEMMEDLKAGSWRVVRGDFRTGMDLGEEDIATLKLGNADLHIVPAVAGAKNSRTGGILKVILGLTLIAFSFGTASFLGEAIMGGALGGMTWGSAMGMVGLSMALTGISSMLAPENKEREEQNSFVMSGPTGAVGQGNPVPLVYGGPVIVGSVMISGGIDIDQLKAI